MSKVSRESASDVTDYGPAEDRGAHLDGYAVIFTSIREDWDLTPLLKGLPGDSCQCPHWGYVTAGRMTVRYGDREEVIEPGDAFYMPPGHVPAAVAGTELVMFSGGQASPDPDRRPVEPTAAGRDLRHDNQAVTDQAGAAGDTHRSGSPAVSAPGRAARRRPCRAPR